MRLTLDIIILKYKIKDKLYTIDESHIFLDYLRKIYEAHSLCNFPLRNALNYFNEARLNLSRVDNDTGFRDMNNDPIRDTERLYKDGKIYRVELKPKSNEYYMYDEEDLNTIINLKDIDTRDYEITPM